MNNSHHTKSEFNFFLFIEDSMLALSENSSIEKYIMTVQLDGANHATSNCDYIDNTGTYLSNFANYGSLTGLYWVWKNVRSPYIGFTLSPKIINPSPEELETFFNSSANFLLLEDYTINCPLQENYRSHYYGYDFRMMMSILKKRYPLYYNYAQEHVIASQHFIEPTCIVKLETFRKFCAWMFPILADCQSYVAQKKSLYQNRFLEHLAYYLFIIYIKYNEKKFKIKRTPSFQMLISENKNDKQPNLTYSIETIQQLLLEGNIERAYFVAQNLPKLSNSLQIITLFEQYDKERRYYKETLFDKKQDIQELLSNKNNINTNVHTKKVLIFEWASVSHKESIIAFEQLGFEIHTYKTPYQSWIYDEAFLDQFNRHLDHNSFDIVFTLNYFAMIAEACYVHNTHYVAWCYDSPTFIGDLRYLKYPTNHVFMFDSSEAQEYQNKGLKNVFYMPLAVNVDRYDSIKCTTDEIAKYQAPISFVGSLYDTKLIPAMNYLTDYQNAYLKALVNNQLSIYDYNFFQQVLTKDFMNWLSNPYFNRAINSEWDHEKATIDIPPTGRLMLLLNKMVTNRERLVLISMLSKHWDFKLYSNSSHEVFTHTIQCGTVNYYKEMPKVFKNSKINLNITLRSIQTGIPLRCLDIMGCHGLLMTNYQKDLDEHFKDQENLLIYHNIEEAYDKVKYYLSHETERQRIENNGYETVKKFYNYPDVLRKILIMSDLGYLLD